MRMLKYKVQPFAEVIFQDVTYETRTEQGANPIWREEFIFDFKSKEGDYSCSGLTKIEDILTINIFDEVSFHMMESSSLKGFAAQAYYGKQWLRSVALPFPTLFQQSTLADILTRLEHHSTTSGIEPNIYTMLDSIKEYQVTGMPNHMAFVDVNQVIRDVWNTKIHSTETPGTQLALAVHVEDYPKDILSVWVFLATLVRWQEESIFHPRT
ncbi:hypothetical protein P4O66_013792 [Electrophorus voltai]|uniref:C2 domain-containing protein n=1 Tax=Electrophorus voltai TaxID=2609070 RepID=A0AAD8Z3K0_9TELE|nr:hypothetical protein P4O66_013792 [Electrophorus voltai]